MKHRIIYSILALFAFLTPSAQIIWTEEHTHFDLHFEPIALIAVSQQEIQLSPSMTITSGLPAFTDSLSASFHLRYTISPVSPGPQLVHSVSLPIGLSSSWSTITFLPASGTCSLAPSATHNGTDQLLTSNIFGHSGTAPQDGIPLTVRISWSHQQYQNLFANLHLLNLTYQCL